MALLARRTERLRTLADELGGLPGKGAGDSFDLDALGDQGELEAADICMVTRPARVAANEILVRPVEQGVRIAVRRP